MAKAAQIDAMAAKGEKLQPVGGVPVGIKDVMVTRGVRTTAGSKVLKNFVPPYDCTAVARMEAAGAVVLGKMNCDEFAMGSSNENSAYKPVHNPRDLTRVPGGSSGGSAAAVASGMAVVTLVSDTGGSIRQPSSCRTASCDRLLHTSPQGRAARGVVLGARVLPAACRGKRRPLARVTATHTPARAGRKVPG